MAMLGRGAAVHLLLSIAGGARLRSCVRLLLKQAPEACAWVATARVFGAVAAHNHKIRSFAPARTLVMVFDSGVRALPLAGAPCLPAEAWHMASFLLQE